MRPLLLIPAAFVAAAMLGALQAAEPPDPAVVNAALAHQAGARIEARYTLRQGDKDRCRTRYVRMGGMLFREDRDLQTGLIAANSYSRSLAEYRSVEIGPDGKAAGWIADEVHGLLNQQDLLETALFPLPMAESSPENTLQEWVKRAKAAPQPATVDGDECWRFDIENPIPSVVRYVIFLDPEVGLCPRRIEIVEKQGPSRVFEFSDYADLGDDVWFPKKLTTHVAATGGETGFTQTVCADSVVVVPADSKEDLTVKFPSGTVVRLGDSRDTYTVD